MKEMTKERAVEILDPTHRETYDSIDEVNEACRMGMEALKKQVPAKPCKTGTGALLCPCCNRFLERREKKHGLLDIPFCKWCGQAIDWRSTVG